MLSSLAAKATERHVGHAQIRCNVLEPQPSAELGLLGYETLVSRRRVFHEERCFATYLLDEHPLDVRAGDRGPVRLA